VAVVAAAHDKSPVGREHGQAVSEAAHQNKGWDDSGDSGSSNSGRGSSNSGKGKN
jgi:hypothetical protein